MRFCDKLPKLRKNNNMSQEQLADRLGVSRQAVSKWESGQSYPDMDKMIQMCNILNCTLEDLLDDGTIDKKKSVENKINFNNYFDEFLNFITKISNMFSSMNFKQKIKCIFEMITLSCFIALIGFIICNILNKLTYQLTSLLPDFLSYRFYSIFSNLYFLIIFIVAIIILIHLFKIRYLDYFITIEDQNVKEKKIEEPIEKKESKYYVEKPKEKIIIRDPKHSTMGFFEFLIQVILIICKGFAVLMIVPTVLVFFGSVVGTVISFVSISYGILFLWVAFCLIGMAIISYQILEFLFNFIFNKKMALKRMFIVIVVSILIMGVGVGLFVMEIINYHYVDNLDGLDIKTRTEYMDIDENTILFPNLNVNYVIDDSLSNVKLEIKTLDNFHFEKELYEHWKIQHIYLDGNNLFDIYKIILNDLEKKTIRNYDLDDIFEITVYLSQSNYDLLKNNYNEYSIGG